MRAYFRRHPLLAHLLGALSLLPLALWGGGDGHTLQAFFWVPIALAAAQAAAAYGNKPQTREFMWIPPSKQEQFGNKTEKQFWRDQVGTYTGAPVQVFRTAGQAAGDYATADAMGGTGVPNARFSGATARALSQAQNQMAQEAAAQEGFKRHAWALGGKMDATARRADLQAAINSIHASVIGQNKGAEADWRSGVNQSLYNLGSTVASSLGGYLGSRSSTTPSQPATGSAGASTPSYGFNSPNGYAPYQPVSWAWRTP